MLLKLLWTQATAIGVLRGQVHYAFDPTSTQHMTVARSLLSRGMAEEVSPETLREIADLRLAKAGREPVATPEAAQDLLTQIAVSDEAQADEAAATTKKAADGKAAASGKHTSKTAAKTDGAGTA